MTSSFSGGFLRDDDTGALVIISSDSAASPVVMSNGYMRDADGVLVYGSEDPETYQVGALRDADLSLVLVDYADADSPVVSVGFLRDSTGAIVTVDADSAASPTGYADGFVRDANYALLVDDVGVANNIAFVRLGGHNGTSTVGVTTIAATVPAAGHAQGNTVLVAVGSGLTTVRIPTSVTDSKSNTYTIDNSLLSTMGVAIASSTLTTALVSGDTITAHFAGSTEYAGIDTAEFSSVGVADQVATNSGTAVSPYEGGTTATLSQTDELAIGLWYAASASGGSTPADGWTKLNDLTISSGTTRNLLWIYQILNSTAAVQAECAVVSSHTNSGLTTTYKGT